MKKIVIIIVSFFFANFSFAQDSLFVKPTLTGEEREVYIQKAIELRKNENYLGAILQLDSILHYNEKDAGALLFRGDLLLQAKKYKKAAKNYKKLLPLNYEPTITKINLSYALFLSHKPKKALKAAQEAYIADDKNVNAIINYFNAMLWNVKTKEASDFLDQNKTNLDNAQQLVMKARLLTSSGDYESGLNTYATLVKNYDNKYFTQEYAEVLIAKKEYETSQSIIKLDSSTFTPNEYKALTSKVASGYLQSIGAQSDYFKDIAENIRYENSIYYQQQESNTYRYKLGVKSTIIESNGTKKATGIQFNIGCDQRWNKALTGKSSLELTEITRSNNSKRLALTGNQEVQYQPNDRKMLGLSLKSEILNYTAGLYENRVRLSTVGYKTHLMFNAKNGFYSQGNAGIFSDQNKRYLFFGSLYHTIRTEPTLKTGINFSAVHFTNTQITDYFSPNRYLNTEVFMDYTTPLPHSSKLYLHTLGAVGVQKIETNEWEPVVRLEAKVGANFNHFIGSIKYQTSNVTAVNGVGYKYNWITAEVIIKW